jgi:hypothetical protein
MVANSSYSKTKDAVSASVPLLCALCAPLIRHGSSIHTDMTPVKHRLTRTPLCMLVLLMCQPLRPQLRRSFDALDQDHDGFITSAGGLCWETWLRW